MSGTSTIVNPATADAIAQVPQASEDEVDAAVERARTAQRDWAKTSPKDR